MNSLNYAFSSPIDTPQLFQIEEEQPFYSFLPFVKPLSFYPFEEPFQSPIQMEDTLPEIPSWFPSTETPSASHFEVFEPIAPKDTQQELLQCPLNYEELKFFCKKEKDFKSLANRNLKSNFGTGFIQFLEFKKDLLVFQRKEAKAKEVDEILGFLRSKINAFISFDGWKEVLLDKEFGKRVRRFAKEFFGKSFARTYVQFGKIKEEYKGVYYEKIKCFYEGAKNPEKLNPANYNRF